VNTRTMVASLLLVVLVGCGGNSPDPSQHLDAFPLTISPTSVTAGGGSMAIVAQSSSGLCPSGSLLWNGHPRITEYHPASTTFANGWSCYGIGCFFVPLSTTSAYSTATLNASDVAQPGVNAVSFQCPGGISESVSFTVVAANPVPILTNASPNHLVHGGSDTLIDLIGTNFAPGATAEWNGVARPTAFASSSQLQMKVLSSDLQSSGTAQITVFNPAPGGGRSAAVTFTID
jgi:hypothetical protein